MLTDETQQGSPPPPLRILLVEDSPVQARLMAKILAGGRAGHRITVASSAEEGLTLLSRQPYDLILLDYTLPGMSGMEALTRIRAQDSTIPIILATGSGSEQIAVEAMKRGASDYIIKEETLPSLLPSAVEQAWQKSQLERENRDLVEKLRVSHDQISELYTQLKKHSEGLEHTVAERTRELQERNAALEAASRHKSEFLATMSHELRTPLNSIIGFSELLQDSLFGPLTERQKKYVANIHGSGQHLLRLINDILDLSKVEAGKMELHIERFAVPDLLEEAIGTVSAQAAARDVTLTTSLAPEVGLFPADPRKVKQILFNLLSNAIKFNVRGGRVEARARMIETDLEISVVDTGIGIREEDRETIFEEFRQVDGSYSRQYEGTGLGLALTKKFVEMQGGRMTVTSEVGKGSTFTLSLPPAELPAVPVPEETQRILIIDDDPNTLDLFTHVLKPKGFTVLTASGGMEGIQKALTEIPHLILLDLMMPGVTGFDVLQALKTDPRTQTIPILIVTAKELTVAEEEMLAAQVDLILHKGGLSQEELLRGVGRVSREAQRKDPTA